MGYVFLVQLMNITFDGVRYYNVSHEKMILYFSELISENVSMFLGMKLSPVLCMNSWEVFKCLLEHMSDQI